MGQSQRCDYLYLCDQEGHIKHQEASEPSCSVNQTPRTSGWAGGGIFPLEKTKGSNTHMCFLKMHVNSEPNWLLIRIWAVERIKITLREHLMMWCGAVWLLLCSHLLTLLLFSPPLILSGFVNENLRLKNIDCFQEGFSTGFNWWRRQGPTRSTCLQSCA